MHSCTQAFGETLSIALGKAFEAIHTGDENILHATVLQLGNHLQPALGTRGLGNPQPKYFLVAVQIDPNCQVHRQGLHRAGIANFNVEAVEIADQAGGLASASPLRSPHL
jgi:hypothetical protein